ncbi:(2E,6E)-farnesyl diphosphate synthase [Hydrocarboniclastica marina]|uniref:(2E,6E)-farnesyl diphosphate synthase n=1 Tax=Hydrocarboniclastica marina TaxID=2259620 RepID=A0A4P7XF11_9ALTE|nr:farnesyl diphosphate synthase [Hydrocarboniclastica marina]MAL99887.1 (2E,6E)-farnesyl diphosphate synthase [Alteromonadaceae bacterium]QCF25153.1 (2E,6E)-farnesyl diphosphate synthase [Hydrocarboniclastica marina]|tara:strand:- start:64 stop:960 length:897 start_codon:yes stop_codon:yes gene_type:complete
MRSEATFERYRQRVQSALDDYLPAVSTEPQLQSGRLYEAMRYSVLAGGKRLRPVLAMATCKALGGDPENAVPAACALELIHAYSLVHDDLPAMDNDDLRRGRPTCHIAFDEATAILCGDALQAMAFEILADAPSLSARQRLAMVKELARASGHAGMVGGQAIDLDAVGKQLDIAALERMHRHKTGALIEAATLLGAMAAGSSNSAQLDSARRYAAALGLAFQVKDDILDVEGETHTLGKQRGADADRNKPTFPALLGLDAARQRLDNLHQEACSALKNLRGETYPLQELADFVVHRKY